MKKALSTMIIAALVASAFTGCGGNTGSSSSTSSTSSSSSSSSSSSTSSTSSASSTPAATGPVDISIIGVDWGFGPLANSEMEQAWEKMFNVNMDIQWVNYEDYPQKINTLISTNSQPDVIQNYVINSSIYYPIFVQAIEAGNFVDLTKYLFNNGTGVAETNAVMKNWEQSMWDQATYNGGIYVMPRAKAEIAQQSGINVRRDLMKTYGFETEPTTMDELKTWLIDLSAAASKGEGKKIYGLNFAGEDFMQASVKGFAAAFTGQMDWGIGADGEFQYMQFSDDYINFLNWMKDLYNGGAIDPEFALGNKDTSNFKSGNSVAVLTAWYNWNQSADRTTNKIFDKALPDTLEAWCLLPVKGPKSSVIAVNPYDIDQSISISSACDEAKILKILDVFNATEEVYPGYDLLMSDGVEGIHYTKAADGTMTKDDTQGKKRTEGYVGGWNQIFLKKDADQITAKFKRAGAAAASEDSIKRAEDIRAELVKIMDTGITHANTNLVSKTYQDNWSTLIADVNATCTLYVMGKIDEAQWKTFVDGLKNSADYKAIQAEFKAAAAN